jgi:hypothetical protein
MLLLVELGNSREQKGIIFNRLVAWILMLLVVVWTTAAALVALAATLTFCFCCFAYPAAMIVS